MSLKHSADINSRQFGFKQEVRVCQHLQQQGLVLAVRNYSCRQGEIDLIMIESGQFLVFLEIRFRSQERYGGAIASVTYHKQRKIRLAAAHFLATHPKFTHFACRFDVVGVSNGASAGLLQFEWIRNAFQ